MFGVVFEIGLEVGCEIVSKGSQEYRCQNSPEPKGSGGGLPDV